MKNLAKYLTLLTIFVTTLSFADGDRIDTSTRPFLENEKNKFLEQEKNKLVKQEKQKFSSEEKLSFAYANDGRIETGLRALSEDEKNELIEQEKQKNSSEEKLSFFQPNYNQYPAIVFNSCTHNLVGVSVLGDYLIIQDGSEWRIKPGYSDIFSWKENHPIVIIENNSFYSSYFHGYHYKMINVQTNADVEVKLHLGPILENPYTLLVAAINPSTCEIILSDNSLWQLDPSQRKLWSKWLVSDGIIVGTNVKGWYNNSYDNILINVNIKDNPNIRANRAE